MSKSKQPPTLADRLRSLRAGRGLTQQQLADAAGLSQQAVGHLESGYRREPKVATLNRLARALGVAPGDLFGG